MENPLVKADLATLLPTASSSVLDQYIDAAWRQALVVAPLIGDDRFQDASRVTRIRQLLIKAIWYWHRNQPQECVLQSSHIKDLQAVVTQAETFSNGPHSHFSANPPYLSSPSDLLLNGPTPPNSAASGW